MSLKLDTEHTHSHKLAHSAAYRADKSKVLPMIGTGLIAIALAGCMANKPKPNEPVQAPEANEQTVEASAEREVEPAAAKTKTAKRAGEANADQLMATLKAPLEEPTSQSASTEKTAMSDSVKQAEAEVQKTATTAEQEVVEKKAEMTKTVETTMQKSVAKVETAVSQTVEKVQAAVSSVTTSASSAKPLSVTKKDLPVSYDIWVIRKGETSLTQGGLVIATPTWEMGKESYMSQIWLTLTDDAVHVNSSSDIASEVKGLGISIDGGSLIPFTSIVENNIAVVEGKWLDKLASAKKLTVYLGFFPGKRPTSERFVSETNLDNLDRMVATYRKLK